jgi:hypothetical protein
MDVTITTHLHVLYYVCICIRSYCYVCLSVNICLLDMVVCLFDANNGICRMYVIMHTYAFECYVGVSLHAHTALLVHLRYLSKQYTCIDVTNMYQSSFGACYVYVVAYVCMYAFLHVYKIYVYM